MTVRISKLFVLCFFVFSSLTAFAQMSARDQANKIHNRLVGLPATADMLNQMEALIVAGDTIGAANLAMTNPAFLNVSIKNWVTPWTNEVGDVHQPLNDYTATIIGIIRDDIPYTQVLSGDIIYVGASGLSNVPAYSQTSNAHYEALEENRYDLSDDTVLVQTTQSGLPDAQIAPGKAGGVMTTRASSMAFMSAGTNRLVFAKIAETFLCKQMEELNDVSLSNDRVRQDVTRSPGGNSNIFLTTCIGCHTGMDPLVGAYAYYDWDDTEGRLIYTDAQVRPKFLINGQTFPGGYVTTNDGWENYWREGLNSSLGWSDNTPGKGNGASSMGEEIASSEAFAACQVQKVFDKVCMRKPRPNEEQTIKSMTVAFRNSGYKLKTVFAEVAAHCAQ